MKELAKPHGDLFYEDEEKADHFGREALKLTLHTLKSHGNQISSTHKQLLWDMTWLYTLVANGNEWGRYAIDMPTGGGKTTSVVCFAKTMIHLGPPMWSMAICASRIEELADIYGGLTSAPVPLDPEHIGVWHSDKDASIPPTFRSEETERYQERRIVLLTHARIQQGDYMAKLLEYRGKPRNLVVYDESLISTGSSVYRYTTLTGQLESVIARLGRSGPLADRLKGIKAILDEEVEAQHSGASAKPLTLPIETELEFEGLVKAIEKEHGKLPEPQQVLLQFVRRATNTARVLLLNKHDANQAVIHSYTRVPDSLSRMIVLDASYPIRALIEMANRKLPHQYRHLKLLPVTLQWPAVPSQFKRYDHVTVHLMKSKRSGRDYLTNDFSLPFGHSEVDREIAQVVAQDVPADKAVLIWTFKQRDPKGPNYVDRLRRALKATSVDPDETLEIAGADRPRIVIETFGRETASNQWKYCEYVIFTGGIELPLTTLAADYLSEMRDITQDLTAEDLDAISRGEIWHRLFQAMSRSAMRDVWVDHKGQSHAKATHVYLFTRHHQVEQELGKVLSGVRWETWKPRYIGKGRPTKQEELAERIRELLDALPRETLSISVKNLKALDPDAFVGVSGLTFQRARDKALEDGHWSIQGRTLVKTTDTRQS